MNSISQVKLRLKYLRESVCRPNTSEEKHNCTMLKSQPDAFVHQLHSKDLIETDF